MKQNKTHVEEIKKNEEFSIIKSLKIAPIMGIMLKYPVNSQSSRFMLENQRVRSIFVDQSGGVDVHRVLLSIDSVSYKPPPTRFFPVGKAQTCLVPSFIGKMHV